MFKRTLIAALTLATPVLAATEDFEAFGTQNFPVPPGLTTGGFTFGVTSSGSTPTVRIFGTNAARTSYVLACDFAVAGNACEQTLDIAFPAPTDTFATDLLADDSAGSTATFRFTNPMGTFDRTFTGFDGGDAVRERAMFGGLGGATAVSIFSDDPAGLGYDNISTDAAVPLPAPLALLAGGIGALGMTRRRRG